MAGRSLSMSIIEEIKRQQVQGHSIRQIAKAMKRSRKTIRKYLAESFSELTSPPAISWTDMINWDDLHDEVVMRKTPIAILWEEQIAHNKCSVQYPAFWKQFTRRFPELEVTMARQFSPGERIEIDYCDGIEILVPSTGEIMKTHLFMGVLCHSRYVYGEFSFSQKSQDFLSSHVRMFEYFGGTTGIIAPDNLKSGVTKTHRYDPEINPAYTRLASHYDFVVVPARVRTPKDKAIIERSIQIFQKWFFFRVRNRTFTSLVELNQCLLEHIKIFHQKRHRIFKKTRQEMYEEEKKVLRPLPLTPYEISVHKKAKLHTDCHLEFEHNFYSAPWKKRGQILDVWATDKVLEIYHEGERIALHNRFQVGKGKFQTIKSHYPHEHQAYLEITPSYLREMSEKMGANVFKVIECLLNIDHPLAHLRRCQGILSLGKKYSPEKLNRACEIALRFEKYRTPYIEALIRNDAKTQTETSDIKRNENPFIRGDQLYQ